MTNTVKIFFFIAALLISTVSCSSSQKSTSNSSSDQIQILQLNVDSLTVYNEEEVDQEPELENVRASHLEIRYPEAARKDGAQGTVKVELIVTKEGEVANIQVVQSVHPALDKQTVRALSSAIFAPGIKDGEPVYVKKMMPIDFSLSR